MLDWEREKKEASINGLSEDETYRDYNKKN